MLGQIRPGEYFSILEIQEAPSCDLCYKAAAPEELQALSLETNTFQELIANEASLAELMQTQARQRSQAYCSRPKRKFFWRR